jgi:signal transduction histidine kinase
MSGDPSGLAVVAHEIRSPVAALVAIADAYADSDEARQRRLLELAAAALITIERLLVEAPTVSFRAERLDVGRLARDAAETAALTSGSSVVTRTDDGLVVAGDPERLRQALDNLIGNAIAHSPDGGDVTVTAARRGGVITVEVTDEGDGIPAADLERMFEPGVRLTRDRPGSGLGLAVVRAIARAHGGEVEVESTPGQGATFRLVLPGASGAP